MVAVVRRIVVVVATRATPRAVVVVASLLDGVSAGATVLVLVLVELVVVVAFEPMLHPASTITATSTHRLMAGRLASTVTTPEGSPCRRRSEK